MRVSYIASAALFLCSAWALPQTSDVSVRSTMSDQPLQGGSLKASTERTLAILLAHLQYAIGTKDLAKITVAHQDLGVFHFRNSRYEDAIAEFQQVLSVYRQAHSQRGEALALGNVAASYDLLGQKQRALDYFQQSLPIWREIGDPENEASTLGRIGDIYRNWNFPELALKYYNRAFPIFLSLNDKSPLATFLNNRGLVYLALQKNRQSRSDFSHLKSIGLSRMSTVRLVFWSTSAQR